MGVRRCGAGPVQPGRWCIRPSPAPGLPAEPAGRAAGPGRDHGNRARDAPAPATPAAPANAAQQQQGTPATVLDTQDYESLLGRSVRSAGGDELGRVIDIIIDKDGHPRAAIIDFGGFLGVGTRKIAVDWRALRFTPDGNKERKLSVALTRNQVRVSPEYKAGEPIVVLGPASPAAPRPTAIRRRVRRRPPAPPRPRRRPPPRPLRRRRPPPRPRPPRRRRPRRPRHPS
ncbi:hypothetical protein MBRA_01644 [Methylobacterium brachiatum]|nr:hypothetical protein MBRA_01644 [Methylobacterium brachiatum]